MSDVKTRDESDMNRSVAPLKKADDASLIDTSAMNLAEVLGALESGIRVKAQEIGISL